MRATTCPEGMPGGASHASGARSRQCRRTQRRAALATAVGMGAQLHHNPTHEERRPAAHCADKQSIGMTASWARRGPTVKLRPTSAPNAPCERVTSALPMLAPRSSAPPNRAPPHRGFPRHAPAGVVAQLRSQGRSLHGIPFRASAGRAHCRQAMPPPIHPADARPNYRDAQTAM